MATDGSAGQHQVRIQDRDEVADLVGDLDKQIVLVERLVVEHGPVVVAQPPAVRCSPVDGVEERAVMRASAEFVDRCAILRNA